MQAGFLVGFDKVGLIRLSSYIIKPVENFNVHAHTPSYHLILIYRFPLCLSQDEGGK